MIIDKELQFSEAQDVSTASGLISTNVIDLAVAGSRSMSDQLWLVAVAPTALVGTGLTIAIQTHTTATTTSGTTLLSRVFTIADFNAGFCKIKLPVEGMKRYLGLSYTEDTLSAGTVTAFLTNDIATINI